METISVRHGRYGYYQGYHLGTDSTHIYIQDYYDGNVRPIPLKDTVDLTRRFSQAA